MVSGQWSVVSGQWSVVSGQWSVVREKGSGMVVMIESANFDNRLVIARRGFRIRISIGMEVQVD